MSWLKPLLALLAAAFLGVAIVSCPTDEPSEDGEDDG